MAHLNKKEEYKKEVILKVIDKTITQKEAAYELVLSDRQIRRLVKKYKEEGDDGFMHKNRGRKSSRKVASNLIEEIENDYLSDYYDYNFTQYYEEKGYTYNISYDLMFKSFYEDDIVSPLAQRNTIKLYNEKMNNAIKSNTATKKQETLYKIRKDEEKEKHFRKSCLHLSFGEDVQMDATFNVWFNNEETALHLAVDRATKKVLYGWFDYEETTEAYMILLMNIIDKYGIPERIKTDKRNSFSNNNARSSKGKLNVTQFGRICEDLEIKLDCNSNPLFKPNVERENNTFKGRLKAELRHKNITDINAANRYLNEIFIPKINKLFSYDVSPKRNKMRKNTYTEEALKIIISTRKERTIDNASSLKYYSKYYQLLDDETGEIISYPGGTKCQVVTSYDKKLYGIVDGKVYHLFCVDTQEDKSIKASKNGFKPKTNHPWKQTKQSKIS